MSLQSEDVTDNLGKVGGGEAGHREITLSVIIIKSPKTRTGCSLLLPSVPGPLFTFQITFFYELVRSIRAERSEIMRGKHFNKNVLGLCYFRVRKKGYFCGDGSFILPPNKKPKGGG